MEQMVKTMRRVLKVVGTLFMAQVVVAVFLALVGVIQGRSLESWTLLWGWALPAFRDGVVCYTLAWIVGKLALGEKEEEIVKSEEG